MATYQWIAHPTTPSSTRQTADPSSWARHRRGPPRRRRRVADLWGPHTETKAATRRKESDK